MVEQHLGEMDPRRATGDLFDVPCNTIQQFSMEHATTKYSKTIDSCNWHNSTGVQCCFLSLPELFRLVFFLL